MPWAGKDVLTRQRRTTDPRVFSGEEIQSDLPGCRC